MSWWYTHVPKRVNQCQTKKKLWADTNLHRQTDRYPPPPNFVHGFMEFHVSLTCFTIITYFASWEFFQNVRSQIKPNQLQARVVRYDYGHFIILKGYTSYWFGFFIIKPRTWSIIEYKDRGRCSHVGRVDWPSCYNSENQTPRSRVIIEVDSVIQVLEKGTLPTWKTHWKLCFKTANFLHHLTYYMICLLFLISR